MIFRLFLCSFLYYSSFSQNESLFHLRGTDHAKKCKTYAGVTGTAVYESETNICYICEISPKNNITGTKLLRLSEFSYNIYNTTTKRCSNGETPLIYFSIYLQ